VLRDQQMHDVVMNGADDIMAPRQSAGDDLCARLGATVLGERLDRPRYDQREVAR